jgi:hypothetical protein
VPQRTMNSRETSIVELEMTGCDGYNGTKSFRYFNCLLDRAGRDPPVKCKETVALRYICEIYSRLLDDRVENEFT